MTKYMILPLVALMTITMSGCVGESGGDNASPSSSQAQTTTDSNIAAPVKTIDSTIVLPTMDTTEPEDMNEPVLEVEPSNDSPAAALVGGLNAYKNMDLDGLERYFASGFDTAMKHFSSGEEVDEQSLKMLKVLFEPLEWEVRIESIDGDQAMVEVDIMNKSASKAMEDAVEQLTETVSADIEGEDFYAKFTELLRAAMNNEALEKKKANVIVYLEKGDKGWVIADDNFPLFIAVQGGSDVDDLEEIPGDTDATTTQFPVVVETDEVIQ